MAELSCGAGMGMGWDGMGGMVGKMDGWLDGWMAGWMEGLKRSLTN